MLNSFLGEQDRALAQMFVLEVRIKCCSWGNRSSTLGYRNF